MLCISCTSFTSTYNGNDKYNSSIEKHFQYVKDDRTNLCFVTAWGGGISGGPIMSYVPCTKEVEKFIISNPKLKNWWW